ncbi:MAG: symmetrical bis(5'-nucleosyl)-tetraphosphatase [Proteobacteria bacterium]|nr:symmetrical bis(5'-nucleosyl)-tetraphosphatase [Pseudomonadota bacterium]
MTRYAVGDVQGCHEELKELLGLLNFSWERDEIYFVGDLVNRGPASLQVLRFVRSLGDNAVVVLGNHDLHLLAVAHGARRSKKTDTLEAILAAPDREALLEWLITRPMAHVHTDNSGRTELMVHAGVVPQWTVDTVVTLAREVESALRADPRDLFDHMYGDEPEQWADDLSRKDRLRFTINVLTRLRVCTADGRVDLKWKGKPPAASSPWKPWFEVPERATGDARIIFGHWSALGFVERNRVVGLDSGCVWGGSLTAIDLDSERPRFSVPCGGYQVPDD